MPRHAKAWKFKRPLSQNEEPFRTEILFIAFSYLERNP